MKRSRVNEIVREGDAFIRSFGYLLPPFAYWSPADVQRHGADSASAGVFEARLGWDITDYGQGEFDDLGLFLFTVRNGRFEDMGKGAGMLYAEKIMISRKDQLSPMHRHVVKAEDIINRGGGNVLIRVYNSLPDESIDRESDVTVHCDGRTYTVVAGTQVRLTPGESIHIQQYMYHDFEVESGTGPVLLGEVSQCNDDNTDNRFNPPVGRFPKIEEDEAPYRLLCNEYPKI